MLLLELSNLFLGIYNLRPHITFTLDWSVLDGRLTALF